MTNKSKRFKFVPMTIHEARQQLVFGIMHLYGDNEANTIAEMVMEKATGWPRIERIMNKHTPLSLQQEEELKQFQQRLQNNEPVQYILEEAWFAGMKFYVDKNVLIPRPETEELVECIVNDVKGETSDVKNDVFRILDIGTGTGCIPIALKKKLPGAEVWACDISDAALTIARKNADDLDALIDFVPVNFLDEKERLQLPKVQLLVSNPPYIPATEKHNMAKHVTDFEPGIALFVSDDDALVFYKALIDFAEKKLEQSGKIYVEIHEDLAAAVTTLFTSHNYSIEIKKDMQGKNRMIKAWKNID